MNIVDKRNGFPGIRGVLTAGNRTQYTNELTSLKDLVHSKSETDKENIVIYSPNEFQMNTAFSKAYIMEGEGKKQGLRGSNLYIDICFINYFKEMVNDSPLQELTKLQGFNSQKKPIFQTYMVNYSCTFEQTASNYEMKIFIDIGGERIYTKLYKVKSLWSIEENKFFEMDK